MLQTLAHGGYRRFSDADRAAITAYVMSLPPIENHVAPKRTASPYE